MVRIVNVWRVFNGILLPGNVNVQNIKQLVKVYVCALKTIKEIKKILSVR